MSYVPLYKTLYSDSSNLDAFGRLRVSSNHILLSAQQNFNGLSLTFATSSANNAALYYDNSASATVLSASADSGSYAIFQSKKYFLYRSGQSHFITMTFASGSQETGVTKRIGYFDSNDGVFLEITPSDVSFVIRSTVTGTFNERKVSSGSWNIDSFNGTGVSGITLDVGKTQILLFDLQWLGTGRVRCGFDIDGEILYAHEFLNANIYDNVYMRTSTLPVRYEIENTTGTGGGKLSSLCCSVVREGGDEEPGYLTTADIFNSGSAIVNPQSLLSISLRSGSYRASLKPVSISIINRSQNNTIRWRAILNPSFKSGNMTWENAGSISQKSVTQLSYVEGTGHISSAGILASTSQQKASDYVSIEDALSIASNIAGTHTDVFSVIVDATSGSNIVDAVIQYSEVY